MLGYLEIQEMHSLPTALHSKRVQKTQCESLVRRNTFSKSGELVECTARSCRYEWQNKSIQGKIREMVEE